MVEKKEEVKAGATSSEFQGVIGLVLTMIIGTALGKLSPETAAIASTALVLVYTIGRVIVKKTATKWDDMIIEELGKALKKKNTK